MKKTNLISHYKNDMTTKLYGIYSIFYEGLLSIYTFAVRKVPVIPKIGAFLQSGGVGSMTSTRGANLIFLLKAIKIRVKKN